MASKYSPYQILQLLQVSSWRCKTTLDYTGFGILAQSITQHNVGSDHVDIQQNYLNDLLLDSRKAIASGDSVNKSEQYINAILAYNDCSSWKDFQQEVARCERFLEVSKIDFSKSQKQGISVLYEKSENALLTKAISHLQSNSQLAISAHPIEINGDVTELFDERIQEYPFVVWCISDRFNNLQSAEGNQKIQNYTSSGQVIPIRISETMSERHLSASILGKKPIPSGMLGFYLSIAIIQRDMEVLNELLDRDDLKQSPMSSSRFHVAQNKGTVYQVNTLKGGNITLGGNFVQKIYKNREK